MTAEILVNVSAARDPRGVRRERHAAGGATSSAPAAAAWSATSTRAACRACCPACRRRSSTSASSAPRSCMPPTSYAGADAGTGIEPPRTDDIRALVTEGDDMLVQVVKDPLGTKGARLTTYITLPSRFLVYMPQGGGVGVSARIEDEAERERLRDAGRRSACRPSARAATSCAPPPRARRRRRCSADMLYLRRLWELVRAEGLRTPAPGSSCTRTCRCTCACCATCCARTSTRVLVDARANTREMLEFARHVHARVESEIELYAGRGRSSTCTASRRRSRRRWTARCR